MVNDTEPQPQTHTNDILCELTKEFNNDELCNPKINPHLAKANNEVWGKKLTPETFKIRLNKHLKPENCDQFSPALVTWNYLLIFQHTLGAKPTKKCLPHCKNT